MSLWRDELHLAVSTLERDLVGYQRPNGEKWAYYDAEIAMKNIGVAVPESMVNVEVVLGWPEIIVDALDERLDWLGWAGDGNQAVELMEQFRANQLAHEFDKAKLDSFVTGVGFIEATAGDEDAGEPRVVANAVSSMDATYRWDARANRASMGLVRKFGPEGELLFTLYLPDRTVAITRANGDEEISEHVHNRGRCGLIPFPNRTRAGQVRGKSEITRSIRYLTEHGVRTLLGMEYNREIYTTPQRWFKNVWASQLGLDVEASPAQNAAQGVKVSMNRVVVMEPNQEEDETTGELVNGPEPATGQYQSAPPDPYINELQMLAQLASAQSGVPANYFGFHTQNPPSADAIRALESRLVKKAERRQSLFDQVLKNDLAFVVQSILDDAPADSARIASLSTQWRDPATPTRAASVDSAVKLRQAEILDGDSEILLEMIGLTPDQVRRVQEERSRSVSRRLVEALRDRQQAPDPVAEALAAQGRAPEEVSDDA